MVEEYRSLSINPERRKRFFKHVILNTKKLGTKKSTKMRSEFVKKLDKLRNVNEVDDLHRIHQIEPLSNKKIEEIEKKISRILDYEHYIDDEARFNRQILSRLSANEDDKVRLLHELARRQGIDAKKLEQIESKLRVIEELKSKVRSMQTVVRKLMEEERKLKKNDTKIFEVEELLKKDRTMLQEDEIKIEAMKNKLNSLLDEIKKREADVHKDTKKTVSKRRNNK